VVGGGSVAVGGGSVGGVALGTDVDVGGSGVEVGSEVALGGKGVAVGATLVAVGDGTVLDPGVAVSVAAEVAVTVAGKLAVIVSVSPGGTGVTVKTPSTLKNGGATSGG